MRYCLLLLAAMVCLCGCKTTKLLPTDYGRQAFLHGDYTQGVTLLEQAKAEQREFTQQSYASLYGSLMKKTFVLGAYQPMYRDRFLTYFYLGMSHLGLQENDQAATEMEEMLRMMDELAAECSQPVEETSLEEIQNEVQDDTGKLSDYYAQTQEEFNHFADLEKDPSLARFYNPAALLLAAFLEGIDGNDEEFAFCCAKVAECGKAPETLRRLREGFSSALAGKALVILAVGHGPLLTERVIGVESAQLKLMSFTALQGEDECRVRQNGDFEPMQPLRIQVGPWQLSSEVAANMFTTLAADFSRRERRLYWEQLIRVLVRDLIAEGMIIGGSRGAKRSLARMLIAGFGSIGWFFARQKLMTPDLRCLQDAPWAYQVALVDIPDDRLVHFLPAVEGGLESVAAIPECQNAVVYLNCPDAVSPRKPMVFVVR